MWKIEFCMNHVILEGPVQYGQWLDAIEGCIENCADYAAVYRNQLSSYEPCLNMSKTQKRQLEAEANYFIRELVHKSVSPSLLQNIKDANLTEGRQHLEWVKNRFELLLEDLVALAVLHFTNAISPQHDMSPLTRYDVLDNSKYIELSDFHKARLLYTALGKPTDLTHDLNNANRDDFKLEDLLAGLYVLEDKYIPRKRISRKRKHLYCFHCQCPGHLDDSCYRKKPKLNPRPPQKDNESRQHYSKCN